MTAPGRALVGRVPVGRLDVGRVVATGLVRGGERRSCADL